MPFNFGARDISRRQPYELFPTALKRELEFDTQHPVIVVLETPFEFLAGCQGDFLRRFLDRGTLKADIFRSWISEAGLSPGRLQAQNAPQLF